RRPGLAGDRQAQPRHRRRRPDDLHPRVRVAPYSRGAEIESRAMRTVIKNGRVVTAVDDYNADILIEDGKISVIAAAIDADVDKVIDAKGRLVIPGGIDPHTHMELPFGGTSASDTFETGTRAAAHGGTTTIIDFAVQYKGQSLKQAVDAWHAKADGKTSIDYGFHLICTDLPDERLPEMRSMIDEGVSSFKLFMAYPGVFL